MAFLELVQARAQILVVASCLVQLDALAIHGFFQLLLFVLQAVILEFESRNLGLCLFDHVIRSFGSIRGTF